MGAIDFIGGLDAPWALWLIAPLVVPVLAALVMWWRGRPRRPATDTETIAGHRAYLQALEAVTRGPEGGAKFDG
jgi:hypothetical protein